MRRDDNQGPVAKSETGPPTAEHRKAGRAGQLVFGSTLTFLIISGMSTLFGYSGVALSSAGISVALFIVGLMLYFESVRQQQRADPSRPRYD